MIGKKIYLRHFVKEDGEQLFLWSKKPVYFEKARFTQYKDLSAAKRGATLLAQRKNSFAICSHDNDKVIGMIELYERGASENLLNTCEVGFLLDEKYWHQGLMKEALQLVCQYAFNDLGMKEIWAGVFQDNDASINLLGKMGFEYIYQVKYPDIFSPENKNENYYLLRPGNCKFVRS
ncbi:GNAT family N-acetyltransferase [Lactobacillus mulieris]|uniref:GNAT family N-acetyltransferase n=1 Tax=Lactobacillus mulieris TaxID=2508708 RepID=A0AAW5WWH4_9LACO|nr:GNAT family N-acetyltransferase [Lactobacillus mulieris]MCZ3621737.1 GNAT family N-acetyltransferase [Lactobacillus mulieris]MCZ3623434.1 GNAT family N-acetyltransferase [Lactobacillus mulieris]MCZ3635744.1 GNAT family N-acetyltransferase [Lactobacillus mulieris]MCZ3690540.1 GNAT family N-acetyltransferase [Lactobacillus mulieris]MCZ3696466.1 GNAT family N-acetyltransferase [Lactobacillus mulieris]